MPHDASIIQSIHLLHQAGKMVVPADSGIGDIGRPRAVGPQGGRLASLETFFDYYINNVPPPDEAKLLNPNIEQVLRMHPDVAAAMEKRTFSVSAMPWRCEPNPDAPDKHVAQVVADHCRHVIKKIPNFAQVIEHLQYAVLVGGQGLEVVWRQEANGVEIPISIHPVHMSRFSFDRLGNMALLTRYTPVWGSYVSGNPQWQYGKQLPRGRFIYHIYKQGQGQWDRPDLAGYEYFGIGLDVALYYVVTFDVYCLKFRMKFLERYGIPPTVLYVPDNKMTSREVMRIADSLRGESLVTIPRTIGTGTNPDNFNSLYKVDQMPVPTGSYDFFEGFSDRYTLPRVNAIMLGSSGEAKSGSSAEGSGDGYSSDVSKRDAGPNIWFKRDAQNISETLTTQFIPAIVLGRFPGMTPDYWPIFSIEPKEEKDRMQEIQIAKAVSEMVPLSEDHIYDLSDSPKPQQGEKTIGGQQQQGMPPGAGGAPPPGNGHPPGFPKGMGVPKNGIGDGLKGGAGAVANRGF